MSSKTVTGNLQAAAPFSPDANTRMRPAVPAAAQSGPATLLFAVGLQSSPSGSPITWESDLPVVHMLADLLSASNARAVREENDGLLCASAGSALRAVILAGRAQKLAGAYTRQPASELRSLSVAVSLPDGGTSDEQALRSYLKASQRSGEVLLAGGAYRQLEPVPGLQMRRVPVSPTQRLDLYELVLPVVERPPQPAIRPQGQTAATTVLRPAVKPEPLQPRPSETADDTPAGSGGVKKMIIGAVAAVGTGGRGSCGQALRLARCRAVCGVEAGRASRRAGAGHTRTGRVCACRRKGASSSGEKSSARSSCGRRTAPAHEAPTHGGGGFTADQIRSILDKADTLAGNGKYDDAIRNYNVVLASDPGNARAREGKSRAVTNKNMQ